MIAAIDLVNPSTSVAGGDSWTIARNPAPARDPLTEYAFDLSGYTLIEDIGYKLSLIASGSNTPKPCYTASELIQTAVRRMAEDTQGQIEAPHFKTIELLAGGSTAVYIVPTVPGPYDVTCAISGNAEQESTGTVAVE